jgi:hypothetical protein
VRPARRQACRAEPAAPAQRVPGAEPGPLCRLWAPSSAAGASCLHCILHDGTLLPPFPSASSHPHPLPHTPPPPHPRPPQHAHPFYPPTQFMHWTDAFTSKLNARTKLVAAALTCEGAPKGGDAGCAGGWEGPGAGCAVRRAGEQLPVHRYCTAGTGSCGCWESAAGLQHGAGTRPAVVMLLHPSRAVGAALSCARRAPYRSICRSRGVAPEPVCAAVRMGHRQGKGGQAGRLRPPP